MGEEATVRSAKNGMVWLLYYYQALQVLFEDMNNTGVFHLFCSHYADILCSQPTRVMA
jgi:hypothetical protein